MSVKIEPMPQSSDRIVHSIPLEEIFADDEFNCRGAIAPIDVVDLAKSIQANGLQAPIVLQPYTDKAKPKIKYRIISGHRRYYAHKVIKKDHIDALIKTGLSDIQARQLNLEENLKRKDLNILQEARAIQHFFACSWTEDMVATELGVSRGWVQVRRILLNLDPKIQLECAAGLINQDQIKDIAKYKKKEEQFAAVRMIKEAKMRGEKPVKLVKKKIMPHSKAVKNRTEVLQMLEHIMEHLGPSFATRALAWCAGEINNIEFYRDIKAEADKMGKRYEMPREIKEALIL